MENGKNLAIVACLLVIGVLGFLFIRNYQRTKRSTSTPAQEQEHELAYARS